MSNEFLIENWCVDDGICEMQCLLCGDDFIVDWINWVNIVKNIDDEEDFKIMCPTCGAMG